MAAVKPAHLHAAERAADAAGAVLRSHFRTTLAADLKPDRSPVTLADAQAEAAIRAVLAETCPDHAVLAEETGAHRPPSGAPPGRYRWAVDPIDGTRAFITGRPLFATLIALLEDDIPILGLIDQPITGERWVGCIGQPTRFTGGAGRTGTRPAPTLADCELSCTSPQMFRPSQAAGFDQLAATVARVTYGGDAYAYGLLALGQIDIVAEDGLKLWDWAALSVVIAGAGGCLTNWAGHPLRPEPDGTAGYQSVLALGNPALLAPTIQALAIRPPA